MYQKCVPLSPFTGLCQTLQNGPLKVLYTKLDSTANIECDCFNINCDSGYWFRSIPQDKKVEFIGSCNNAERTNMNTNISSRFTLHKKSSSFLLRIVNVSREDTAIYSCVLKDRKNKEVWKPGTLFLPGGLYPEISNV